MQTDTTELGFDKFFQAATHHDQPFDYQRRLACGDREVGESEEHRLSCGADCASKRINIPTGLGKTAAVVLAWLWNRLLPTLNPQSSTLNSPQWPRRLVYCLPMRTLVEQTEKNTREWLTNLKLAGALPGDIGVHVLMGGEDAGEWDIYPEKPAILIGTQDMLLSRALNRGYGMSRYRWPIHFGLLNNDCLWVMDETQLMGPGLGTACQLEAFRAAAPQGFHAYGGTGSVTWYMSATNNPEHLKTREWRGVQRPDEFEFGLADEEKAATSGEVHKRRFAAKQLELQQRWTFKDATAAKSLVAEIRRRHESMLQAIASEPAVPARTLVICNTVDRAKDMHALLLAEKLEGCDLLLLHSRFRPPERRSQMERLNNLDLTAFPKGQIVVSTQVIEAGVDVSSGVLWSEVAPLASLVQRLGRLNRAGEFNNSAWPPVATIVGVGAQPEPQRETKEQKQKREHDNTGRCRPYAVAACESAWDSLGKLNGNASPAHLETIQSDIADSIPPCPYSLQRHELLDFFDTDANLSLGFTDVSPFVRGLDDDTDLQVLWREGWIQKDGEEGIGEPGFTPDFQRDELCPVPISKWKYDAKAREVLSHGWHWRGKGNGDQKESGWLSVRDTDLAPGMTILLPLEAGGYHEAAGWTGDKTDKARVSHYRQRETPSDEEQLSSLANGWQSIAVHTDLVAHVLGELLRHLLANEEAERNALTLAVPWHDIGKNHPGWQAAVVAALKEARIAGMERHQPFAKFSLSDSPVLRDENGDLRFTGRELARELKKLSRHFRPEMTHEVASALAFRQAEHKRLGLDRDTNLGSLLAEYAIMSHHGRVRKVLRDEMPRFPKNEKDTDTVRGIKDGSAVPIVPGLNLGCDSLSTDCRRMGRDASGHESYTRCVLRLLEHFGPFRLAYFEAIFRAADVRASKLAARKP
jgi:CRISPR-associated endonuclease/helicase Cas3